MSWQDSINPPSNNTPSIDMGACAESCFAGVEQGLTGRKISADLDAMTGIAPIDQGAGPGRGY